MNPLFFWWQGSIATATDPARFADATAWAATPDALTVWPASPDTATAWPATLATAIATETD